MYACWCVTCHLHFWQNDKGSFTCHCGNTGVERTPNTSQHTKLTLEKKILPPLPPGFEPATFRSRVRRSNQRAVPARLFQHQYYTETERAAVLYYVRSVPLTTTTVRKGSVRLKLRESNTLNHQKTPKLAKTHQLTTRENLYLPGKVDRGLITFAQTNQTAVNSHKYWPRSCVYSLVIYDDATIVTSQLCGESASGCLRSRWWLSG